MNILSNFNQPLTNTEIEASCKYEAAVEESKHAVKVFSQA